MNKPLIAIKQGIAQRKPIALPCTYSVTAKHRADLIAQQLAAQIHPIKEAGKPKRTEAVRRQDYGRKTKNSNKAV